VMLNNVPLRMPQAVAVDVGVAIVVVLVTVGAAVGLVEEEVILMAAEVEVVVTLAAEGEAIAVGQEEDAAETVADAEVEVAFKMGVLTEEAAAFEEEEEVAIEEAEVGSIVDVAATAVDAVVSVWGVAPHVAPLVAPPLSTPVFSTVNHNLNWFHICRKRPPLPLQPHLRPRIRTGLTKIPMPTLQLTVKPTTTGCNASDVCLWHLMLVNKLI